jgi:hypothetical protein
VRAASWFHDGSAQGPAKTGYGNNWVIVAVIVRLPGISRPVGIPVTAQLVIKGPNSKSRLWLARRMSEKLAGALPGRAVRAVADSACAGGELKELPAGISWATRLRKDAALHGLPPARTGKPGRPRVRGKRLPPLAGLAATAEFSQVTVIRCQKTETIQAAMITCLWYSVFGSRPVRVVLIRDKSKAGCDLALVTTDRDATMIQVIERYASRLVHRSRDTGLETAFRHRPRPQPHRPCGRAHRPFRDRLPGRRRHLVCHRRPHHRRPARATPELTLAHQQGRTVHQRHDRPAPPRPHRRQI